MTVRATSSFATAAILAGITHAHILLDTFSDAPSNLTDTTTTQSVATFTNTTSAFGGTRAHFLSQIAAPGGGGTSTSHIGSGFSGTNTFDTASRHSVYYGSVGISADQQSLFLVDRDYDFSAETGFLVTVDSATKGSIVSVQLRDSGPNEPVRLATFSQTLGADITSPTVLFFDRTSPTQIDANFHWERLDYIRLRVETPLGGSFQVSKFETVPEPATMALTGCALAALARRRRQV